MISDVFCLVRLFSNMFLVVLYQIAIHFIRNSEVKTNSRMSENKALFRYPLLRKLNIGTDNQNENVK